jgi:DNA-binding IclR family transcriptional regulator
VVTKAGLLAELARVRKQGYAIDDQENELDGRCIGASIQTAGGRVVAAVSISGPVLHMDMNLAKSLAPPLKTACAEIGEAIRRG